MTSGTLGMLFIVLFLLFGLGFTVAIDPYIRREDRRIMLVIVALCLTLIAQNLGEHELYVTHSNLALKNVLSAYGYSVRPVFLVLFLRIIAPGKRMWPLWALAGANVLLYCSSPLTGLCFTIRETDFIALRGPLWPACIVVSAILLAYLLAQTILRYKETKRSEHLIPLLVSLAIIASVVLDLGNMEEQPISFLTIAIVAGSLFYYVWLHFQFVREHERDLMAGMRAQIMMTQIQPHFLFNALNTIRALYAKDPPLADRTLEDFSTYLRQNLDSLNQVDLIPIADDLEHARIYAQIETLRFPNVSVEYHIEDEDFQVPALTVQPLVENAIRHGVRGVEGGVVSVSTACEADAHRITIADNGVGFDPDASNLEDKAHVGLRNVRERVERMCGGTMVLHSEIGQGTSVTLLIPDGIGDDGRKGKR